MPWSVAAAAAGAYVSSTMNKPSPSGGGASGGGPQYVPTDQSGVDNTWQNLFNANAGTATNTAAQTQSGFDQTLNNQRNIDYAPYIQSANNAAQGYNYAGNMGMAQGEQYGQMANTAQAQQAKMYGYGDQIMNTAMDPQSALYNRTQQQLTDQTRAGQAARGLGDSAEGAMEESGAMSNFNIDWQNNQLQRQVQGMGAASQANQGGIAQGQLYGADQSAALNAVGQGAGYYGQAGNVAMGAQQYAANAPGVASQNYMNQMAGQQGMYGTAMNGAQSYMQLGQSAQMGNYNANTAQNQSNATLAGQLVNPLVNTAQQWYGNQNQNQNFSGIGQTNATDASGNNALYGDYGYGG